MADIVKSTPKTELEAARQWTDLPADELKRAAATAARDRDLETLWDITRAYMTNERGDKDYSANTLAAYRRNIKRLLESWQHVNLLRPDRKQGGDYRAELKAAGLAPSSIVQALSAGRALYAALRWSGATDAKPFHDVKAPSDPVRNVDKRKPYTTAALTKLFAAALEPGLRLEPTTPLMLLLGAHAGLRVFEMTALRYGDIDLDARTLTVRAGKGGKHRTGIALTPDVVSTLQDIGMKDDDALVFGGATPHALRDRMRRLCDRAGVAYLGLHSLRHTFAFEAIKDGASLKAIGDVLGHANPQTTAIYADKDPAASRQIADRVTSVRQPLGLDRA